MWLFYYSAFGLWSLKGNTTCLFQQEKKITHKNSDETHIKLWLKDRFPFSIHERGSTKVWHVTVDLWLLTDGDLYRKVFYGILTRSSWLLWAVLGSVRPRWRALHSALHHALTAVCRSGLVKHLFSLKTSPLIYPSHSLGLTLVQYLRW